MPNKLRSLSEISIETRALITALEKLAVDEIVSYAELSRLIGRDVQKTARHNLTAAVNRVLRDSQIVVSSVRNVGLRRISDTVNVNSTGAIARRRIQRTSVRAIRRLSAVDFDVLNNEDKVKHNAEVSQLNVVKQFATTKSNAQMQTAVVNSGGLSLTFQKTLAAFTEKPPAK